MLSAEKNTLSSFLFLQNGSFMYLVFFEKVIQKR